MSTLAVDGITNGDGSGAPAFPNGVSGNIVTTGNLTATGIYLGGTGSANLLDDYEEGTWTPLLKAVSVNPSITYNDQQGYYTKVGNLIWLTFLLDIGTINSSGSGDLYIDLPFTAPNGVGYATGGWMPSRMSNATAISGTREDLTFSLVNATNALRLTQSGGSSSTTQWTNGVGSTQIGSATLFSGTYMMRFP